MKTRQNSVYMGKLRFRGTNDFSKSQRGQQQSWYQPRPPGSQADVFAKPRLKCPSQEVAGGGGVPGWPHQSSRLRSQPPSLFPCEVPERVLHWEGGSLLTGGLSFRWRRAGWVRKSGGQGFSLWVTPTHCLNYSTKCPAASRTALHSPTGYPGSSPRKQGYAGTCHCSPCPTGSRGSWCPGVDRAGGL